MYEVLVLTRPAGNIKYIAMHTSKNSYSPESTFMVPTKGVPSDRTYSHNLGRETKVSKKVLPLNGHGSTIDHTVVTSYESCNTDSISTSNKHV